MKACSFIGHRNVQATKELCDAVRKTVKYLIEEQGVEMFLFGSKSRFDDLCVKTVRKLKNEYPNILLVYVRSRDRYLLPLQKEDLLRTYDDTIMPSGLEKAGKAAYVERNQAMIDASEFCVFYYDENYQPTSKKQSKSGTKLAYEYARKNKKVVLNLFTNRVLFK